MTNTVYLIVKGDIHTATAGVNRFNLVPTGAVVSLESAGETVIQVDCTTRTTLRRIENWYAEDWKEGKWEVGKDGCLLGYNIGEMEELQDDSIIDIEAIEAQG
jgi:hypothetical protein